jgi:hypothetical protein
MRTTGLNTKLRYVDIQRQRWLAEMREKRTLSVYEDLKHSWGREAYASCCCMKERSGIEWFQQGIWTLKGVRGAWKGVGALCVCGGRE